MTFAIAALLAAGSPAAAYAATASSTLGTLSYDAAPGEANRLTIARDGAMVRVADPGATLVLGIGCLPEGLTQVRCLSPLGGAGGDVIGCETCMAKIRTGDRDDVVAITGRTSFQRVLLEGGPGDDRLSSDTGGVVSGGAGNDTLTAHAADGGPGNDTLLGTEDDDFELLGGGGADLIQGNGGIDTTSYADRGGPIQVTLDGRDNDGAPGERDDIRTENVDGGSGGDVLIGDGAANTLGNSTGGDDRIEGAGGRDVLIGGPGHDTFDGGEGNDTVLSFLNARGVVDDVRCGAGDDEAQVSRGDRVALDCEHVYFGGTPGPRLTVAVPARPRASRGILRLSVQARPEAWSLEPAPETTPANGPAISATAILEAVGGAPAGVLARTVLAPFAAPGTAALALRLRASARRALARRGRILMRLSVSARDADGNESLTRRMLIVHR